jgi:hypothetical protein
MLPKILMERELPAHCCPRARGATEAVVEEQEHASGMPPLLWTEPLDRVLLVAGVDQLRLSRQEAQRRACPVGRDAVYQRHG